MREPSSRMCARCPILHMNLQGRSMRANRIAFVAMMLIGARVVPAQVVASIEISDPALRTLQEQSFNDLKTVGQKITAYQFSYPFYLSRKLDIDEKVQKRTDQHSIRLEH